MSRYVMLLLILAMSVVTGLPGCKKKGETADVTEGEVQAEVEKKKKKKKKKKKGKKGKKKKKDKTGAKQASGETGKVMDLGALAGRPDAGVEGAARDPAVVATGARTPPAGVIEPSPVAKAPDKPEPPASRTPAARGVTPPPVKVAVARLLTVADLNQHLPEKGWISYGAIQGIPTSEHHNSIIYRKPGTNQFVTLLVWDFELFAQALEKWNELFATYPNASEIKDVFTKFVFFYYRNQVNGLVFIESGRSMVISVACHSEVCNDTALYELAKAAYSRAQ